MTRLSQLAAALTATLALALVVPEYAQARTAPPAIALAQPALAQDDSPDPGDGLHDAPAEPEDLSALRVFNRVILLVKDNYVDPKRVNPKEMMLAALDYVQRTVADVIVDKGPTPDRITVTVGPASKEFDISGVDTLWKLSFTLKDVFGFMQEHLEKSDKPKDIEYAAVAGMLSTLDPHSVFLQPEAFKEMKLQTKGEFGGLGFVIQMKDSQLTVVKVLKNTPAYKAGIKAKDKVTKIEEQSTVNLDLNDAVSKLRGRPNTKINITVVRKGWPAPKRMTLVREIISIESVESRLLDAGLTPASPKGFVAGIKIKSFQGNTSHDLMEALGSLRKQAKDKGGQLAGVVLDLRGNPGGLLEQAIEVTNAFVDHGVIVTTVGYSDKMREVKRAHSGSDVESELPVAVLVDNGSASASEIVSGALKNLDRAVIVGRPTFGKGSVQVLYDFVDDTALKLTIAQYLTPGDISIQETGIVPDIELDPAYVSKDHIDAFSPKKQMGEADLEHHFGNPADLKPVAKRADVVLKDKPSEIVRYFKETPKPKPGEGADDAADEADDDAEEAESDADDDFKPDFQVKFARDLVLAAPQNTRSAMIQAAHPFVAKVRQEEQTRISAAITALGVDWVDADDHGTPKASVDVKQTPLKAEAGQTLNLAVTVQNQGGGTFHELHGYTLSENPWLDRREFVFGTVAAGEKKTWSVPIKLPKDMMTRRDEVKIVFGEAHDHAPADQTTEVQVLALPRPAFAFNYQVIGKHVPEDGLAHVGEEFELKVDVTNEGPGPALAAFAILKNLGDEKVFLKKGRDKLDVLKPGETKTATFEVALVKGYRGDTVPLRMQIVDEQLDEFVGEKLNLPVAPASLTSKAAIGAVRIDQSGPLVETRPFPGAPPVAQVKKGAILPEVGKVANFYAVEWKPGRIGFVPDSDSKEVKQKPTGGATEVMQLEPPKITVNGLDTPAGVATSAPVAEGDHYPLSVTVSGPRPVRDVYVFVNEQKVFFHAAGKDESPIKFDKSLPLKPGNNTVLIVAREDDEYAAKRSFVVLRRSADEVAKSAGRDQAPKPQ